jgi:hypothetical protein
MTCLHKFSNELELKHLDYQPEILIVGTFNPSWPKANYAQWFYGRTDVNYFWDVLPRIFEGESLLTATPDEWKAFCKRNKIAITDLIKEIKCFDESCFADKSTLATYGDNALTKVFENCDFTNLSNILKLYPTIRVICFTRKLDSAWKRAWNNCGIMDLSAISELYTPSRYASYATSRWRRINNYDKPLSVPDFILGNWIPVFEKYNIKSKEEILL